jgi:hypothetical protein
MSDLGLELTAAMLWQQLPVVSRRSTWGCKHQTNKRQKWIELNVKRSDLQQLDNNSRSA